jgi:hypothetical protein
MLFFDIGQWPFHSDLDWYKVEPSLAMRNVAKARL